MPLRIKDPEVDKLAHMLSRMTGRSLDGAVLHALREQVRREKGRDAPANLAEDLMEIGRNCAALPNLDDRTDDQILGYDGHGTLT
jgi:antitoxin VapB